MVNDAGSDSGVYRELDAAGRALLNDHDPAPLLRLTEQDVYTGDSGPVREFNDGLYQATASSTTRSRSLRPDPGAAGRAVCACRRRAARRTVCPVHRP